MILPIPGTETSAEARHALGRLELPQPVELHREVGLVALLRVLGQLVRRARVARDKRRPAFRCIR